MVRLPWIRNRNGGSTSAPRMTINRVASTACWRAESRAQRPVRASVAAMSRTCARSADVVKDRVLPGGSYVHVIARYGTARRNLPRGRRGLRRALISQGFLVSFCQNGLHILVRPRESGDPGATSELTHVFNAPCTQRLRAS